MFAKTEYALIDGSKYKIDTNFKTAIKCNILINSDAVDDIERAVGVVTMLFGEDCPLTEEAVQKAGIYLANGSSKSDEEQLIDYEQDWNLIYSAFMGQYGIDLDKSTIDYGNFINLMQGLNKQVLNNVVMVRNYDLSEIKSSKERARIQKLKESVSIKKKESSYIRKDNEFMEIYFKERR